MRIIYRYTRLCQKFTLCNRHRKHWWPSSYYQSDTPGYPPYCVQWPVGNGFDFMLLLQRTSSFFSCVVICIHFNSLVSNDSFEDKCIINSKLNSSCIFIFHFHGALFAGVLWRHLRMKIAYLLSIRFHAGEQCMNLPLSWECNASNEDHPARDVGLSDWVTGRHRSWLSPPVVSAVSAVIRDRFTAAHPGHVAPPPSPTLTSPAVAAGSGPLCYCWRAGDRWRLCLQSVEDRSNRTQVRRRDPARATEPCGCSVASSGTRSAPGDGLFEARSGSVLIISSSDSDADAGGLCGVFRRMMTRRFLPVWSSFACLVRAWWAGITSAGLWNTRETRTFLRVPRAAGHPAPFAALTCSFWTMTLFVHASMKKTLWPCPAAIDFTFSSLRCTSFP